MLPPLLLAVYKLKLSVYALFIYTHEEVCIKSFVLRHNTPTKSIEELTEVTE